VKPSQQFGDVMTTAEVAAALDRGVELAATTPVATTA
jgi:hypothetical protein